MSEIRNVNGTFQEDNPLVYVREVAWCGTIIVEDDGWFKGMITNTHDEKPYRVLTFGYLKENKIDLFQTLSYSGLMMPHHYECNDCGGLYKGDVKVGKNTIGDARIYVSSPIELSQEDQKSLEQEIGEYEVWNLIGNSKNVYLRMCWERKQAQKNIEEPKDDFDEEVSLLKRKKYSNF